VLVGALKSGGRDGVGGERRLRVGEARGWRVVQVAAFPGTAMALATAVRPVLGTDLPTTIGEAIAVSSRLFLKVGPEQFWIITRDNEDLTRALESVVPPTVGSVTPLSHSRTCIWIDGPSSREVLATGVALDLDPAVFPLNSFALTGLHHTPILVLRSDATRFELYVSRTFAVWTWEWLTDAALPYGYEVHVPN
jgi:heterotetrameric sarcosine oxidase gamma subunit